MLLLLPTLIGVIYYIVKRYFIFTKSPSELEVGDTFECYLNLTLLQKFKVIDKLENSLIIELYLTGFQTEITYKELSNCKQYKYIN